MRYCPDCGTPHECTAQAAGDDSAVKIARINADRDVRVAELTAKMERAYNDTQLATAEIDAEVAADVAMAEAVVADTIIGAELGASDQPAEPIIIDA